MQQLKKIIGHSKNDIHHKKNFIDLLFSLCVKTY